MYAKHCMIYPNAGNADVRMLLSAFNYYEEKT